MDTKLILNDIALAACLDIVLAVWSVLYIRLRGWMESVYGQLSHKKWPAVPSYMKPLSKSRHFIPALLCMSLEFI